jgi:co-chaperonin GroES (HSP10)
MVYCSIVEYIMTHRDNLLITVDKEFEDSIKLNSGLKLHLDTSFNPYQHATIKGKVAHVPRKLSNAPVGMGEYKRSDITPEVQEGDTLYFHYNTVQQHNLIEIEGVRYYMLPYEQVFCVVRSVDDKAESHGDDAFWYNKVNKIIPIGSHVLVSPTYPEGVVMEDVAGKQIAVRKVGSIIIEHDIKPYKDRGNIAFIGTPLANQPKLDVKAGDMVMLSGYSDFKNKIEGEEYYVVKQMDILGTLEG